MSPLTYCGHKTRCDETLGFQRNVQWSHSLPSPVGHRMRCDEIGGFQKNVQCHHSHPVVIRQDEMRLAFRKMCNVTHFLLGIGQDVMRLTFRKCAMDHSLTNPVDDRTAVMRLGSRKMSNATHKLFVTQQYVMRIAFTNVQCHSLYVMRLPLRKCVVLFTFCWS